VASVTCRSCGRASATGDKTCGYCGSALPRSRTPPAPGPATAPPRAANDDPFASVMRATVRLPSGRVITLDSGDRLMVGRGQDSPLADACSDNISREHAVFFVRDDGVFLQDMRSMNGTYLNGSRLEPDREYRLSGSAAVTFASDPPLRVDVEVSEP
jgi:FHA domain